MDVRKVDEALQARLVQERETLEEAYLEAEVTRRRGLIAQYGEDDFPEGTVLRFFKTFRNDGIATQYTYAVVKATGHWYMTGLYQRGQSMSWSELLTFLVSGEFPVERVERFTSFDFIGKTP